MSYYLTSVLHLGPVFSPACCTIVHSSHKSHHALAWFQGTLHYLALTTHIYAHNTHTHTHTLSLFSPPLLHPHFPFWDRDPPWITQPELTLHNSGKQLANTNQVHSLVLVCPDNVVHILTKGICINGNNSNDTMATTTIAAMRWQ